MRGAIICLRRAGSTRGKKWASRFVSQDIEDLALGVDGAPQIDHAAVDFQIDFIKMHGVNGVCRHLMFRQLTGAKQRMQASGVRLSLRAPSRLSIHGGGWRIAFLHQLARKRDELTSSGSRFALEHEVGAECRRGGISGRSDSGERPARGCLGFDQPFVFIEGCSGSRLPTANSISLKFRSFLFRRWTAKKRVCHQRTARPV
jgi:hypothetical protein